MLEITNRSDRLGYTVALQFLPLLFLGAMAGVVADKVDNRHLLLATSGTSTAIALLFGVIVATGNITIWWVYGLTFTLGVVLAIERPAMQAILFQLVGPDLLPSAVATNGTINSVSRLIGPAIAGVLIATAGIEICFYVNAASYVVVIAALLALRAADMVPRPMLGNTKGRLREGLSYVRSRSEVLRPLVIMAVMGTLAYNFQTTFPAVVKFGFHRGAGAVGTIMSVSAIGSIAGGVVIAGKKPHPRTTLALTLIAMGLPFLAMSVAPGYWTFVAISIALGFGSATFLAVDTVVLQQATDPAMQGRVMALHQIAWFGTTPVGALLMGWIIQVSSPRVPFALGGISALGCAAAVMWWPARQPT